VPQVGDDLVYLGRGHAALFEALQDKATPRPWTELRGIRNAEPCVVGGAGAGLQLGHKGCRLACLLADASSQ
jgi:hypothetical protein